MLHQVVGSSPEALFDLRGADVGRRTRWWLGLRGHLLFSAGFVASCGNQLPMRLPLAYFFDKLFIKNPRLRIWMTRMLYGNRDLEVELFGTPLRVNTIRENGYVRAYGKVRRNSLLREGCPRHCLGESAATGEIPSRMWGPTSASSIAFWPDSFTGIPTCGFWRSNPIRIPSKGWSIVQDWRG